MSARGTRQDWGSFLCTPRRKAGAQERHKTRLEQNLLNRAKQLRVLWVSQGMTKVAAKKKKNDLGKKGYTAHYVHPLHQSVYPTSAPSANPFRAGRLSLRTMHCCLETGPSKEPAPDCRWASGSRSALGHRGINGCHSASLFRPPASPTVPHKTNDTGI